MSVENTRAPSSADQPSDTIASELSEMEKNAVRYTAGYVIRNLHGKYSK